MILQIVDTQGTTEYKLENFGKGTITFGRNSDQDIVLHDINVSRNHGFIYKTVDGWHISDNASTNGVVLNSEIVTDHLLRTGDMVVLSIKNQDRAVQMKVIDDEYNAGTDRVADARSTSRYFRMTTGTTGVLTQNDAPQSPIISQVPNQMPNAGMSGMGAPNASQFYDDEVTMMVTDEPVTVSSASMNNMPNGSMQQMPQQTDVTQNSQFMAGGMPVQPQMPQQTDVTQNSQFMAGGMSVQPKMPQDQMGMQQSQVAQEQVGMQQPQMPQSQMGIQQPQMPQSQMGIQQPQMQAMQNPMSVTQTPQSMSGGVPMNVATQTKDKPKNKKLTIIILIIALVVIIAEAVAIIKLINDNKKSSDSGNKKENIETATDASKDEKKTEATEEKTTETEEATIEAIASTEEVTTEEKTTEEATTEEVTTEVTTQSEAETTESTATSTDASASDAKE